MTNAPPIDLEALRSIYGQESADELLEMSLSEADKLIDMLAQNISERDGETAMNNAHTLKGMAATMTIENMSNLAKQLEHKARAGEWDAMPKLLDELRSERDGLRTFLGR